MSPKQTIAHYRVIAKIGEGGMGEVYRAMDTKLNREVAIKIIRDSFTQDTDRMTRFAREAQVLASLNHPNIAAIYGVEERALVMELVEGPTLEEHIKPGAIPLAEALPICRQIAEALEYAHEKGIIHRDLKPANIKVTADGKVKVLDFGLAKALTSEPMSGNPVSSPTLTMRATAVGVIMGTAAYMSPEQARGLTADRRADIWSFGVLFYEMLTARRMFAGDTVSDTLAAVLKTDPDWSALPSDMPPAIRRLLRGCLQRDRKQRVPDIAVARLEIDEALTAPAETPATAVPPNPRSGFRWSTAAAVLAGLGGLAMAFVHFRATPPEPVAVRFQIPAPEKFNFGSAGMALSPDGRRLAFIARPAGGQNMLFVRPLDSLVAQALPGTEGAGFNPFWSPDSRSIGFEVQQKLKRIEASGGPAQTLCELSTTIIGGSWNQDGVIIFGTPSGGLFRVPQAGGVATQLTKADGSNGEAGHLRPWFLPDGRHFLYITRTSQMGDTAIYLATLDGKERKRLVSSQQAGAYAPPDAGSKNGHLLYLREGTLMAQPLDAKRFELSGEPFPVVEQVGSALALGFFSVSANGVLAYRTGDAGGLTQLVWFDRQGKSLGTLGGISDYGGGLALSPDGSRLAAADGNGNRSIWIFDLARGVPSRFTFDRAPNHNPVWSPDGARLVFVSLPGTTGSNIYQKDSNGSGNEEMLFKTTLPAYPNDWSPDGKYLLYSVASEQSGTGLWVFPATADAHGDRKPVPYLQSQFHEMQGQFSPDGHWVAYISDESGSFQIYVQSFPAGAGKFQVSTDGGMQPRWRRDGKEMFYLSGAGDLMTVDIRTALKFEAGSPHPLFHQQLPFAGGSKVASWQYDVAADGKRFLFNCASPGAAGAPAAPITVVLNWQAALKR